MAVIENPIPGVYAFPKEGAGLGYRKWDGTSWYLRSSDPEDARRSTAYLNSEYSKAMVARSDLIVFYCDLNGIVSTPSASSTQLELF